MAKMYCKKTKANIFLKYEIKSSRPTVHQYTCTMNPGASLASVEVSGVN